MAKLIRRLLSLLFTLGIYDKHYKLSWDGDMISMNQLYSQKHWSARSAMKNKYIKIFSTLLLQAKVKPMKEMSIVLFYASRMDVDNCSCGCKFLADAIKLNYLQDDSNKFYKGLFMVHDSDLKKGTYEYHILAK
jgi:hypothetical protein